MTRARAPRPTLSPCRGSSHFTTWPRRPVGPGLRRACVWLSARRRPARRLSACQRGPALVTNTRLFPKRIDSFLRVLDVGFDAVAGRLQGGSEEGWLALRPHGERRRRDTRQSACAGSGRVPSQRLDVSAHSLTDSGCQNGKGLGSHLI